MKKVTYALFACLILAACNKDNIQPNEEVTPQQIVSSLSDNVNGAIYSELATSASNLDVAIQNFVSNPTNENLESCKVLWKAARASWEQSEGFLYGPVATENIDPRIDSWPIDFNAINIELAGSTDFAVEANMDALDDALKGFHPIEFLLWGLNGQKVASDFTAREKEYLLGLSNNLKKLTVQLANQWDKTQTDAFVLHFTSPSATNLYYQNYKAIFEQMVNALIDICGEVADGKIGEPYLLQDPGLEESPYSSNSIVDFKNNIISVRNVYLGKYNADGKGIEDLVRKYNLTLDNEIKTKINNAIGALETVTDPFGTAITSQQVQVQNAIDAIDALKEVLELQLLPFVQQKVTN